jgi:NADPH2:quinone reductase
MKAVVVHELGRTPSFGDAAEPERAAGEALVEMRAAAINPVDLAIASGTFYGGHPPLPFPPGREGVGVVVEGERFAAGTRVYALKSNGSMAERFTADEADMWELPEGDDDAVAAALGIAGCAGWTAIEWRGRIAEGDNVLVLGATGTVGMTAVQAARLLGAGRVVAAGRNAERLERAVELGADAAVHLGEVDDLEAAFRDAFPGGAPDLVVDPLWGPPALAAMTVAAPGMRLVNLGQSAAAEVSLASARVRGKRLDILGHSVFETPVDVMATAHRTMIEQVRGGRLRVDLDTFPLDRVAEAWDRQRGGPHRKLVVIR